MGNSRTLSCALLVLLSLAGCTSAAEREQERYEALVSTGASRDELCAAAGDVAVAWQMEGNEALATIFASRRDSHCTSRDVCRNVVGGC